MQITSSFQNQSSINPFFVNNHQFPTISPFFLNKSSSTETNLTDQSNHKFVEVDMYFNSPDKNLLGTTKINESIHDKKIKKGKKSSILALSKKIYKNSNQTKTANEKEKPKNPKRKIRVLWKPKEDQKLIELVNKHGFKWTFISKFMRGRSDKQIRDRYINNLKPGIKNNNYWSIEEDEKIVSLCHQYGKKWAKIAKHLPGRSECQIKNRFYQVLKDQLELNNFQKDPISIADKLSFNNLENEVDYLRVSKLDEVEIIRNETQQISNERQKEGKSQRHSFESFLCNFFKDEKIEDLSKWETPVSCFGKIKNLLALESQSFWAIPSMTLDSEVENQLNQGFL